MKKNLLLIHLESMNYVHFACNRYKYVNIDRIANLGVLYTNYFSNSTSTEMVIGDLLYGDLRQYESIKKLSDIPNNYLLNESLLDQLKKEGYKTNSVLFPYAYGVLNSSKRKLFGFSNTPRLIDDYEKLLVDFKNTVSDDLFAYYVCNFSSHLDEAKKDRYCVDNVEGEINNAYMKVDTMIGDMIDLLKKCNKIDSTIIVLYGDHGDDYWTHGMHEGHAHAIEPNALLTHTPLIVYNGQKQQNICNELVDTISVRKMIYNLLHNIRADIKKEYVISRNEYAAQKIRKESFNKGYSITDGQYLLMITNAGWSMYDISLDYSCHNNLLKYARFERDKYLVFENNRFDAHFDSYMSLRKKRLVRQRFYFLRSKLIEEISALYNVAGDTKKMLDEMNVMYIDK